jgi:hypothetical protein
MYGFISSVFYAKLWSVLLVEETLASHSQNLSHNVVSSTMFNEGTNFSYVYRWWWIIMYGFISTVFFMQNWCPYFAFFQCTQWSSVCTKGQTKFTKQYHLTSETSVFEKQRTGLWFVFQSPVGTIVPSCTWSRSVPCCYLR